MPEVTRQVRTRKILKFLIDERVFWLVREEIWRSTGHKYKVREYQEIEG